jgi:hypothetical protein
MPKPLALHSAVAPLWGWTNLTVWLAQPPSMRRDNVKKLQALKVLFRSIIRLPPKSNQVTVA